MFHDEGASTDVHGMDVSSKARMTAGKGSRTSPEKENPDLGLEGSGVKRRRRTKDSVDYVICFFESGMKVLCEWDVEVFELGRETLKMSVLICF